MGNWACILLISLSFFTNRNLVDSLIVGCPARLLSLRSKNVSCVIVVMLIDKILISLIRNAYSNAKKDILD
ncbi:hypothetical protein T02_1198 [Trichinella nativa]|uniref:Uncharacterized protein n=1 Tax=Trichinella nativa TaxID=6335 RepID=A0A0V1LRQ4_9BILA|nr:hypothetical protein T02_1198 [Trichinella nativa]